MRRRRLILHSSGFLAGVSQSNRARKVAAGAEVRMDGLHSISLRIEIWKVHAVSTDVCYVLCRDLTNSLFHASRARVGKQDTVLRTVHEQHSINRGDYVPGSAYCIVIVSTVSDISAVK